MSKTELVPLFHDGADQSLSPAYFDTRENIKRLRKAGELDGWYASNGRKFIIYVPKRAMADLEKIIAGGGFDSAWAIRSSGFSSQMGEAGMLVWQMNTSRTSETAL